MAGTIREFGNVTGVFQFFYISNSNRLTIRIFLYLRNLVDSRPTCLRFSGGSSAVIIVGLGIQPFLAKITKIS